MVNLSKISASLNLLKSAKPHKFYILYEKLIQNILRAFFKIKRPPTFKVMTEDWKYLIILDACRYDYFKKVNWISGCLEKRRSSGCATREWLHKNFTEKYKDVVYISANPFISSLKFDNHLYPDFVGTNHFSKVVSCWEKNWDDVLGTVRPKKVTETALKYIKKFPKKRFIIHYMQPHRPFLKKDSKGLSVAIRWYRDCLFPFPRLKYLRDAYADNLKIVLPRVEELIKKLRGKIVVTSDHGNLLGEYFLVGHFHETYLKQLVDVPWLVIRQ